MKYISLTELQCHLSQKHNNAISLPIEKNSKNKESMLENGSKQQIINDFLNELERLNNRSQNINLNEQCDEKIKNTSNKEYNGRKQYSIHQKDLPCDEEKIQYILTYSKR